MIRAASPLLVICLSASLLSASPQDNVVFRSDVSLVRVDACVADANNRAIIGRHAGDFGRHEDGQPPAH